jgi:voltage-gated potassium channel
MRKIFTRIEIQTFAAASALISLIAIGTLGFRYLEGWSWISSFYFSVTTLTTVGYGDLYPTTEASRLFAAIYILLGVTIALAALGLIGRSYLERREDRILKRRTTIDESEEQS